MQKKRQNPSAYMAYLTNEKGFNLVTLLTMISLIFITLPFFGYVLQITTKPSDSYEELSVHEFFRFIRDDIISSHSYFIKKDALHLIQEDDAIVIISQYDNLIRRQVENRGHEIYLRDIEGLEFYSQPYGIKIVITVEEGARFERTFTFYNET